MKKHYLSIFFIAILACFAGCSEEKDENPVATGKLVEVDLDFGEAAYSEEEDAETRTINDTPVTSTVTLENGMELEAVLSVDKQEAQTRAASNLASDAKIVVIAYNAGKLYSKSVITPGNAKIKLPNGGQFDLVFYSYNSSSITPEVVCSKGSVDSNGLFSSDAVLAPITENYAQVNNSGYNSMWAKVSTGIVTSGMSLPKITFSYINARVKTIINSMPVDTYGYITAGSISYNNAANAYTVGLSNTGAVPTIVSSQVVTLTPESGLNTRQVTFPYRQLLTNGNLAINIVNLTIRGQKFNKTFNFGKSLTSGKSYTITIAANRPTYKLTFNLNGGVPGAGETNATTYAPRTGITYLTQQSIKTAPVRDGFIFSGWTSNVSVNMINETTGPGTQVPGNGYFWMPASDVVLTANWTQLTTALTATCDANGMAVHTISGNFFKGQTYLFTFTNADGGTSTMKFTANEGNTTYSKVDNDATHMTLSSASVAYNVGNYTWTINIAPTTTNAGIVPDLIANCWAFADRCTDPIILEILRNNCSTTCNLSHSSTYQLCGGAADKINNCSAFLSRCNDATLVNILRANCATTCGFKTESTLKCKITTVAQQ